MRLQFETNKEQDELIRDLMEIGGLTTKKDLFNNALTLLDWALTEARSGRVIASINEDAKRYRELQMPILTTSQKKGQQERAASSRRAVAAE